MPPLGATVALPLHNPLQVIFVLLKLGTIAEAALIVNVAWAEHPAASLTLTVYAPGGRFDTFDTRVPVAITVPDEFVHVYEKAGVPPLTFALADPLFWYEHKVEFAVTDTDNVGGGIRLYINVPVHPAPSVITSVSGVFPGMECGFPVDPSLHWYVYPEPLPPEGFTVTVPLPPLQEGKTVVALSWIFEGSVIVTLSVLTHPTPSTACTTYVPAQRLLFD